MTNKSWVILLISGAVVIVVLWAAMNYWAGQSAAPAEQAVLSTPVLSPRPSDSMHLTSSAWQEGGSIPEQYTCDGEDVSPPLAVSGVPEGAQSLVLIVDDPDAPRGDWVHWTVWNIAPETAEIAQSSVPAEAVEGMTDFGQPGWGGPCPPSGEHRYQFKLYALDARLDLPSTARKADIEKAMEGHILEQTVLVGRYSRS